MKPNHIYTYFICYISLVASIGMIGIDLLSSDLIHDNERNAHHAKKNVAHFSLFVEEEEDDDTSLLNMQCWSKTPIEMYHAVWFFCDHGTLNKIIKTFHKTSIKIALYLCYHVLRL